MSQRIALEAHTTFGPMTANATLQVRPGSDVIADPSPALKWLDIWNPVHWSKDDLPRALSLVRELAYLLLLIYVYFFIKGNS